MTKVEVVAFIFRRDLRIEDNLAFIKAKEYCKEHGCKLLPMFIFNPKQIDARKNDYYSQHIVNFMIKCLEELNDALDGHLHFYESETETDILMKYKNLKAIFFNRDYTPYAKMRDKTIEVMCHDHPNRPYTFSYEDYTLFKVDCSIKTDGGNPYKTYTPFYNKCIENIDALQEMKDNYATFKKYKDSLYEKPKTKYDLHKYYDEKIIVPTPGRIAAKKKLDDIKKFGNYKNTRDDPTIDGTTKLSPYMKFGCLSVREIFNEASQAFGYKHQLVKELLWREFYAHLTHHNLHILAGQIGKKNEPFQIKYAGHRIWKDPKKKAEMKIQQEWIQRWKEGNTGFPFVDAGMRQLKATGWMHNRLRMVTAMFFTKDMMVDWRIGEQFFAQSLVDYDPASNSGGWQWCASIGADAAPYFRIFNPYRQSERFDPDCEYIKKWIPELKDVDNKAIHDWNKTYEKYPDIKYPEPMLEHDESVKTIKGIFKKLNDK